MNSEQIRIELIKVLDGANDWQGVRHLMLKLKKEDSAVVLEGLLGIFFLDNSYQYQGAAGGLLWKLKPKYKRNLREDIRLSLKNWNISVYELPWYFVETTSFEKIRAEVKSLMEELSDGLERRKLDTYLYWLSVSNPEEFRNKLNQEWNGRLRG